MKPADSLANLIPYHSESSETNSNVSPFLALPIILELIAGFWRILILAAGLSIVTVSIILGFISSVFEIEGVGEGVGLFVTEGMVVFTPRVEGLRLLVVKGIVFVIPIVNSKKNMTVADRISGIL